jgi:amino acid transporter
VSCTVIFLFFSFAIPITLGLFAWGTSKWDKMGPWNLGEGAFKLFAALTVIAMILIFILGIQPPNEWALYITVGFLVLTAIVWFGFESRRFKGPPIGAEVAKRQAEIAAAEAAVGESGEN